MRTRAGVMAVCMTAAALALVGCADEPRVQEEFPKANPWFEVIDIEVGNDGLVVVNGEMLDEATQVESDVAETAVPSDAGEFPDHIAYGFWPAPDEVGVGEAIDVDAKDSFSLQYDLSRPEGVRDGWHVLQFDKAGWGSQIIWVNVRTQEWSEAAPP